MAKKEIIIVCIVVVLVLIGAAVLIAIKNKSGSQTASPNPEAAVGAVESSSKTMGAVPAGTTVPEVGSAVPENVAPPTSERQVAPVTDSKYRTFDVSVTGDKFAPDTIIVRADDTFHITFLAGDKNYDFYQPDKGLFTVLPKGVKRIVESGYQQPGKYTFYCKSCGGPDKGPVGYIIAVPK